MASLIGGSDVVGRPNAEADRTCASDEHGAGQAADFAVGPGDGQPVG
jgi:hypothetical protein